MLEYDRTDVSEGIDTSKASSLHECIICHTDTFLGCILDFNQKCLMVVMI